MSAKSPNYTRKVEQIDRLDSDGYSAIDILVPIELSDGDMACGGRGKLLERIRSEKRSELGKFCVDCSVKDECTFGKVIVR